MARRTSPYVATKGRTSLIDRLLASRGKDKTKVAVAKQKKKMTREFRDETQALYNKAMDKGKSKYGDLLKIGGLAATIFGGPLGAGLVNFAINKYMGDKQRKASKGLLGLDMDRWGSTFLEGAGEDYMQGAEEQQIEKGKVLQDALLAGGMSALTSGMIAKGAGATGIEGLGSKLVEGGGKVLDATGAQGAQMTGKTFLKNLTGGTGNPGLKEAATGMTMLPMLISPYTKDWQSKKRKPFKGKWYTPNKHGIKRDWNRARGV